MMRDYEFRSGAQDEVLAATQWFVERKPGVANEFVDELRKRIEQAMQFPGAGKRESGEYRSLPMGTYPFRMIYRLRNDTIEVIAVAHTSREPGYWRDRL